jgi:serine/threonine protein kinase
MPSTNVKNKFKLIERIGKGSFGCVYKVLDKSNDNELIACKVENKNRNGEDKCEGASKQRLRCEYNIYKRFMIKNFECVPRVYNFIETPNQNIMTMELLGKSLDVIFDDMNRKLDMGTVLKLGITIVDYLEKIHKIGVIHRDIKPNNFMFGAGNMDNHLYIVDFGLSKLWYENNKHIGYKRDRSMIGTPRYASVNIHMGVEPSRRDDLESVGYMLIYLATGSLPWQGLKRKTKDSQIDMIGEIKVLISVEELCASLPKCFHEYMDHVKNLRFTEKPDYNYLIKIFKNHAKTEKICMKYHWEN